MRPYDLSHEVEIGPGGFCGHKSAPGIPCGIVYGCYQGKRRSSGRIALEQGDIPNAREYFRQGLDIGKEIQALTLLPSLLEGLGANLAISSQSHDAILLLGAASAIRERTRLTVLQIERSEYDRTLSLLHSQVPGESFQKIWDEGSTLSAEQVVTFIFGGNV